MSKLPKKDTKWTILEIDKLNIDFIKKEVSMFSTEWDLDTSRQDNNITHRNTKMYQLKYSSYDWLPGDKVEIKDVNSFKTKEAQEQFLDIIKSLESQYSGIVVRAEVIKMMPNVNIRKHVDGGEFLKYARRCHIPINTNEDVYFTVFNNRVNMKEGIVYEINNSLPHSVENNSNKERDHLILDILPIEMFKQNS